jgi:HD superfamily phosphohydrolase
MYRTVYWHRQVRSATAMIKKALINCLESGEIAEEELYNLDDQSLFSLLRGKKSFDLVESVWNGGLYSTVAEIPFNEADHACLKDIRGRSRREELLTEEFRSAGVPLRPGDLIIDVPEPISFETGLFVIDENCHFTESSSAFKTATLLSFVKTLYTIRIFVHSDFSEKVETLSGLCDIINAGGWIHGDS